MPRALPAPVRIRFRLLLHRAALNCNLRAVLCDAAPMETEAASQQQDADTSSNVGDTDSQGDAQSVAGKCNCVHPFFAQISPWLLRCLLLYPLLMVCAPCGDVHRGR